MGASSKDKLQNCKFVWAYARSVLKSEDLLKVPMPENILNTNTEEEFVEQIGEEQVNEIYYHTKLSASVICVYMRYAIKLLTH